MSVLSKREEIFSISDFDIFLKLPDLIFKSIKPLKPYFDLQSGWYETVQEMQKMGEL